MAPGQTETSGEDRRVTASGIEELFEEFVSAYGRGDDPDVRDFLARAAGRRAELGTLLDNFLAFAPIGPTDEETIVLVNARIAGRTPLQEARVRRKLDVEGVVDALAEKLRIAQALRARLAEAYDDLERDWLDPRGVQASVWDSLRSIFDLDVRRLFVGGDALPAVLMRSDAKRSPATGAAKTLPAGAGKPRDEIDRLFRGWSDA
jgi:hypothetical protein